MLKFQILIYFLFELKNEKKTNFHFRYLKVNFMFVDIYFALNRFSLSLSWQGPFWNGRSRRSRKWGTELAIKFERKLCPNGQFGQRQSFWTNIYSWSGALVYWLWEETRNPRVVGSIPALYTGWTFFHIFAVVIIIMFEQTKINEKEAGDGQLLYKKLIFDPIRT